MFLHLHSNRPPLRLVSHKRRQAPAGPVWAELENFLHETVASNCGRREKCSVEMRSLRLQVLGKIPGKKMTWLPGKELEQNGDENGQ
jgi:hypothetical protein